MMVRWHFDVRAALAATAIVALAVPVSAEERVTRQEVTIKMPDGTADAVLFTPPGRKPSPAIILWHDLSGLRPAFTDMGRKLAADGYVVLVPNAFYRSGKATGETPDMNDADVRARQTGYRNAATDDGIARDAVAYVAYLDGLKAVKHGKLGTLGYDLGGSYAFRTAAAVPDEVAAVASIHGLGVATPRPNSPHLLVPQTKAAYYVVQSKDDNAREPEDKTDYEKVFAEGGLKGRVDIAEANHGFGISDNKNFDAASADKAWAGILALFKSSLK